MSIYLGLFLISLAALSLEVTLVRLLSVATWYHLAFFAISTAMLGMTAGATTVYLGGKAFGADRLRLQLGRMCLAFAFAVPVSLGLLCLLPLGLMRSAMSLLALVFATVACALPFYFVGIVVTAVLTKSARPIGKLYASDLLGAALGCLLVLGGLEWMDAPSLVLCCGGIGALAGVCFVGARTSTRLLRANAVAAVCLACLAFVNARTLYGFRPVFVKDRIENPATLDREEWNSFSRVTVLKGSMHPRRYWGASPIAPRDSAFQHVMSIDGEAGTVVAPYATREDIAYLRYDVTNVGYGLGRKGTACVIGVGGGRDVQSALLFGFNRIVGIDINPVFIRLLQDEFRDFAGVATREEVELVIDEARSYLSRTTETFDFIQMSLIDTWAATGAGAFTLSENALYTVEGWQIVMGRLAADGVFTVSRWHDPGNLSETGRLVSLAVGSLLRLGVPVPSNNIALVTMGRIVTLLASLRPFSEADVAALQETCKELQFELVHVPGMTSSNPLLRGILASESQAQLLAATSHRELNYRPPTDEAPYFFNMLRFRHLAKAFTAPQGVMRGNLLATLTLLGLLLCLGAIAVLTILVPLLLRRRFDVAVAPGRTLAAGAVYFALIGGAFMLLEIAMIQRLTLFLGHPVYALGILLSTLIASTGVGAFLSDRLPLRRQPWVSVYPLLTAACVLGLRFLLSAVLHHLIAAPTLPKIGISVVVVFPMGMLMGLFFPTGMRLAKAVAAGDTPWYWALNGIFGVLSTVVAVLISIYAGISLNFYVAALCYAVVLFPAARLARAADRVQT